MEKSRISSQKLLMFFGALCLFLTSFSFFVYADDEKIEFKDKLEYYLNRETQRVVEELRAREIQLLNLIQNIHNEISIRGKEGVDVEKAAFELVEGEKEQLIDEYKNEVSLLFSVYDKIQELQKYAKRSGSIDKQMQLLSSRAQVASALENRDIYAKGAYTAERVSDMIDDYTSELDSILTIYDYLNVMQVEAEAKNNKNALEGIFEQKKNILKLLAQWGEIGPLSEEDLIRYQLEMQNVHEVIQETREVQKTKLESQSEALLSIQKELLQSVDVAVYDILANAGYSIQSNPRTTQYIREWKAERIADIVTRLTEYQIIWKNFIKNSSVGQIDRMFNAQLNDALENYANNDHLVAEYQFVEILENFGHLVTDIVPVKFYIAESKLFRGAYDAALNYYLDVANDSEPTPYKVEALVRLMQYERDMGTSDNFLIYYDRVLENQNLAQGEILNYAHYLAAGKYFALGKFETVLDILSKIPDNSELKMPKQILTATTYINLNNYDRAMPIYEMFSDESNYPWSDDKNTFIRNTALLNLGLIQYQKGKLYDALSTLDKVSPGFEKYDQVLIAQAWTYYRLRNYEPALEKAFYLLQNYIASDFTYEALVLAAQIDNALGDTENALNAFRYVIRAKGIMNQREEFDEQRALALIQLREIDRLEREAIDRKQIEIYNQVSNIRDDYSAKLYPIEQKGEREVLLLQDYYDEKVNLVQRWFELDDVIEWARRSDRMDIVEKAGKQRDRLITVMQNYQVESQVTGSPFLIDFPLTAREASSMYRHKVWNSLFTDMQIEKMRVSNALKQIQDIQSQQKEEITIGQQVDLELLELEMNNIRDRLSEFNKTMQSEQADELKSNMDYWSEYSGFGVTDIIYQERENKLEEIDTISKNLVIVDDLFSKRRKIIEEQLIKYEQEIKEMEQQLLLRKIEIEQLERQSYFQNSYFDEKESELDTWEREILRNGS